MFFSPFTLLRLLTLAGLLAGTVAAPAGTITVQTNLLGPTPAIIGYNLGHFYPGSNTRDWWRYAGANGARIFDSPSSIEPSDDLPPVGDGVTNQTGFINRKAALRADPLNPAYINWLYFTNHFENTDLYPVNHIKVNFALGELRRLDVQICAQITAGESRFPITDDNDWGGKWELWQHYYADAFYLGRTFDVQRYQMYNEPNGTSITQASFLMRLQLVADAVQSAIADVNTLYGKNLRAQLLAPTAAGNATSAYAGWGDLVVTNRHTDFLGVASPDFSLIQTYDYHQYGASGAGFGAGLASLNVLLAADMAPEPPFPVSISEFNARTAASYDNTTTTLDSPNDYSRFGSIAVNLMANGIAEMYAFKFSQVSYNGNYPIQKNALYYVDNANAPYNVGGVTKAGESYRLFAKAFASGRERLSTVTDAGASGLDVQASYDPVSDCYHIFSANSTASNVDLNVNLAALNLPATNKILLEEVSENFSGGGAGWMTVGNAQTRLGTQPAYSAWLLTIPGAAQATEQDIGATDDAQASDGANQAVNYGGATTMVARNDPASTANRSVAFMKFQLPAGDWTNLQLAVLSFQASSATINTTAQANVYALTDTNWSQATLNWNNAPNLKSGVAAGNLIANDVVTGQGTNASIIGQVVTTSTTASEKLIDVTSYLRGQTNGAVSFLMVQDPRWDVTLPSLVPGDTQPDGVKIITTEGGNGPRLRLVFAAPPANQPPVALNDSAATTRKVPVAVNVLANDFDADGDPLTVQSFTLATAGIVSNLGGGTLSYLPNDGFTGLDAFTYTVADGRGGNATATVNVSVNAGDSSELLVWTNLTVATEANIQGGANATTDVDEVSQGYLMLKYHASPLDSARKIYFQFDLSGLNVQATNAATLSVTTYTPNFIQRVQLWGLDQAYPNFNAGLTWNSAQANDTDSNALLTNAVLHASPIGASVLVPGNPATVRSFTIPHLGDYLVGNRVTLVLSGVDDPGNASGGLRLMRTNARLQVLIRSAVPAVTNEITGILANDDGMFTIHFSGTANQSYRVQAATNLAAANWIDISTNQADADGLWNFTDSLATNYPVRFYRSVTP